MYVYTQEHSWYTAWSLYNQGPMVQPFAQTSRLVKELKAKQKVSGHSPADVERDIELREMRDFGNSVVQQLGSKAAKHPDMMSTLQLLFSQAGLPPPPSPTASRTGSTLSSARSSTSQLSVLSSARYGYFAVLHFQKKRPLIAS